jgi:hypothetical protein
MCAALDCQPGELLEFRREDPERDAVQRQRDAFASDPEA